MIKYSDMTQNTEWKDRALGFLARSRQELWGKHNEDIMAWLFLKGFKNRFIKDALIGWNKRPKERPAVHWGFGPDFTCEHVKQGNLYFPPGIVIPYIVETSLTKLVIVGCDDSSGHLPYLVPGSSATPMILRGNPHRVALVQNILHGLFIHQELGDSITVVVPDIGFSPDHLNELDVIVNAEEVRVFPDPTLGEFMGSESDPMMHGTIDEFIKTAGYDLAGGYPDQNRKSL